MNTAFQQGQGDGLCGLYSILNFFALRTNWSGRAASKIMEYVFMAAEASGTLKPNYLTQGYDAPDLAAILNKIFDDYKMGHKAVLLSEVERKNSENWFQFYCRILDSDGSIIGGPAGRNHWVLVSTFDGLKSIYNSADIERPVKPFDRRQPDFCAEDGIAIIPYQQPLTKIGS